MADGKTIREILESMSKEERALSHYSYMKVTYNEEIRFGVFDGTFEDWLKAEGHGLDLVHLFNVDNYDIFENEEFLMNIVTNMSDEERGASFQMMEAAIEGVRDRCLSPTHINDSSKNRKKASIEDLFSIYH